MAPPPRLKGRVPQHSCVGRRWSSNPAGKCSYERLTRGRVCGTMRSMCGADAGCLAIHHQPRVSNTKKGGTLEVERALMSSSSSRMSPPASLYHTHTHTLSLSLYLPHTYTHTYTLSLLYTQRHTHTKTHTHKHTHTPSLSISNTHTHTHTHTLSLPLSLRLNTLEQVDVGSSLGQVLNPRPLTQTLNPKP